MASGVLLQSLGNGSIWDVLGNALNNHQVYVYQRGTTTQVQVYSDAALTGPLTQPLLTGASGAGPGGIPGYVAGGQSVDFVDATPGIGTRTPAEPLAASAVAIVGAASSNVLPSLLAPAPTGVSATDTANLQAAINAVLVSGQRLELQAGTYKYSTLAVNVDALGQNPNNTQFTMIGQGRRGTTLLSDGTQAIGLNIYSNVGSGNLCHVRLQDFQMFYTAGGMSGAGVTSLLIKNVLHYTVQDVMLFADKCALSIQGSGLGVMIDTEMYLSGPRPTTPIAALWIGAGNSAPYADDGTLTSAGPTFFVCGQTGTNAGTPAILLEGRGTSGTVTDFGAFSTTFIGHQYGATNITGGSQAAAIAIDGGATTATFVACHGESNYNTTNTASDFLIGNHSAPAQVAIRELISWGHGNITNYQQYAIDVKACNSLLIENATLSKLGHTHGYDSGIIHFRAGFPAAGNSVAIRTVFKTDTTGPEFADDNGVIPTTYTGAISTEALSLSQLQRFKAALAYSASITPDASLGAWQTITVTNGTAFTVNAPTNPPASVRTAELAIEVLNSSGGAMGVITWNAAFIFPTGAWANPASTKKRFARFAWNGAAWICVSLATADY